MRLKLWKAIKNLFSDISYMGFLEPEKNILISHVIDEYDNYYLCSVYNTFTSNYGFAIYKHDTIIFVMFNNSNDYEYEQIVKNTVFNKYSELVSKQIG